MFYKVSRKDEIQVSSKDMFFCLLLVFQTTEIVTSGSLQTHRCVLKIRFLSLRCVLLAQRFAFRIMCFMLLFSVCRSKAADISSYFLACGVFSLLALWLYCFHAL